MESIFKKIYEIQQKGLAAVICTIIESKGSTPRKAGSKMLVYTDGSIYGTIGGGSLEFLVIKKALKALQENSSGIFDFGLEKDAGMTCGGFAKVFIEPIEVKKKLYIFGGGHIGMFLADMAQKLNFAVTIIDDRENVFTSINNDSIKTINGDFLDVLNSLTFDENSFICIATYQHKIDKLIAGYCATNPYAYLGMIGSKNKVATLKKELINEKTVSEEQFNRINTPIGIGIACQTPEEIVVSILAKLVDVRASK